MRVGVDAAISAVVAVGIAVLATVLLRAVGAGSQEAPVEPPATAPERVLTTQPEERSVQVIRRGGGCFACPPADRSGTAA